MSAGSAADPPIEPRVFGSWSAGGQTGEHGLQAIEGGIGTGTIDLLVDGHLALVLPGPTGLQPTVVSSPGVLDGREITLYAASPDGGKTVLCDVYLDRVSLNTGRPIEPFLRARSLGLVWPDSRPRQPDAFPAVVAILTMGVTMELPWRFYNPVVLSLLMVVAVVAADAAVGLWPRRGR